MGGFSDDFDTTLRSERELADLQAQANALVTPTETDPGTWVRKDTFTAKGDLPVATSAAVIGRQAVGTDTQVLTADSSTTTGMKWATPTTGSVTTVSVATNNGVSGSVATATTTPVITLTLGAITPTSIISGGPVRLKNYTVGTLPAGTQGDTAF